MKLNLGLGSVLFIVFLVLKLCNIINWSWWWVTCPLWAGLAIALVILGVVLIVWSIAALGLVALNAGKDSNRDHGGINQIHPQGRQNPYQRH